MRAVTCAYSASLSRSGFEPTTAPGRSRCRIVRARSAIHRSTSDLRSIVAITVAMAATMLAAIDGRVAVVLAPTAALADGLTKCVLLGARTDERVRLTAMLAPLNAESIVLGIRFAMTRLVDIRPDIFVGLALLTCASSASGDAAATCRKQTPPALIQLKDVMSHGRFVSYQPTSLQIVDGHATHASEASIADDLTVLRKRFDGLITYGALNGAERIPDVAAKMGFRAVIVGVWDISNTEEIANAIAAWRRHPELVVGISLGNEIVFGKRGTFESIGRVLESVRAEATGVLLTTSEPFHLFYDGDAAATLADIDFMLVNVHPVFQPWFAQAPTENAAQFVVNVVDRLAQSYCGPILVKETGEPTAPAAAGLFAITSGGLLSNTTRRICVDTDACVRVFCRVRRTLAGRRQPPGAGLPSRRSPLGVVRRKAQSKSRRCNHTGTLENRSDIWRNE